METITIAGTSIEPGSRGIARIPVAQMPRGDLLTLTVRVVNGTAPGPVLGLESGSHGDEAFAIQTIHEAIDGIHPGQLRGAVLGMPVCNPIAFETYTRLTGLGMTTDAVNMNTVFPGDPKGSLVAKMAHAITTHYLPKLDALIDFHSGGLESAIDYTLVKQSGGPLAGRILELSKAFGSSVLSITRTVSGSNRSISELAEDQGIPTVVAMLGGATTSSERPIIERSVDGVKNVMRSLDMIDGEVARNPNQVVIGDRLLVRHQQGGVFQPVLGFDEIGRQVPEGTLAGVVRDPYTNEVLEEYRAPYPKTIVIMLRGIFGRVYPGDYGYIFGDGDTAEST
jgi:predicted deacylase